MRRFDHFLALHILHLLVFAFLMSTYVFGGIIIDGLRQSCEVYKVNLCKSSLNVVSEHLTMSLDLVLLLDRRL